MYGGHFSMRYPFRKPIPISMIHANHVYRQLLQTQFSTESHLGHQSPKFKLPILIEQTQYFSCENTTDKGPKDRLFPFVV